MKQLMVIRMERANSLRHHLRYNFYPPIRSEVIDSWVMYFGKYWNNEITYDELIKACPVPEDELFARFDRFLKSEDLRM